MATAAELYAQLREETEVLERAEADAPVAKTLTPLLDSQSRVVLTDDDIVQLAATVPLCSEYVWPVLMSQHHAELHALVSAVIGRQVESIRVVKEGNDLFVRCACPPFLSAPGLRLDGANPHSAHFQLDSEDQQWYRCRFILVVMKATSMLVPSASTLRDSLHESFELTLLNEKYKSAKEAFNPSTQREEKLAPILGFDTLIVLHIVRNHPQSAFRGYKRMSDLIAAAPSWTRGAQSQSSSHERCGEFVVQFDAPSEEGGLPSSPWGGIQFRFISIPTIVESWRSVEPIPQQSSASKEEDLNMPRYSRWLWFLAHQDRISYWHQVPPPVQQDESIRKVWLAIAAAGQDPLSSSLNHWPTNAVDGLNQTLFNNLTVAHSQQLNGFRIELSRLQELGKVKQVVSHRPM